MYLFRSLYFFYLHAVPVFLSLSAFGMVSYILLTICYTLSNAMLCFSALKHKNQVVAQAAIL